MDEHKRQFRFTKKDIEALPPQARDAQAREAEYSDTECVGLKCLVNRQGRKYFYYRYSFNKRRRAIKIGEFPSTTLQAAHQRALELKARVDSKVGGTLLLEPFSVRPGGGARNIVSRRV